MGLLAKLNQARYFEDEVKRWKRRIEDTVSNLSDINPETLELECFILQYDFERYKKSTNERFQNVYHTMVGAFFFYDGMAQEWNDDYLDREFLEEQWERVVMRKLARISSGESEEKVLGMYGMQKAIAGLIEGEMWYDLTADMVTVNPKFLGAQAKWDKKEKEIQKRFLREKYKTNIVE